MTVEHLPDGAGLGSHGIPHVNREDEGVASRMVVENRFARRVGKNPAVPIELAVDANRRKGRRQRAGRHDVLGGDFACAAVEIAHLAGAHMGGADGEPRLAAIDEIKIDQLFKGLLQRRGRVITGALGP